MFATKLDDDDDSDSLASSVILTLDSGSKTFPGGLCSPTVHWSSETSSSVESSAAPETPSSINRSLEDSMDAVTVVDFSDPRDKGLDIPLTFYGSFSGSLSLNSSMETAVEPSPYIKHLDFDFDAWEAEKADHSTAPIFDLDAQLRDFQPDFSFEKVKKVEGYLDPMFYDTGVDEVAEKYELLCRAREEKEREYERKVGRARKRGRVLPPVSSF